MPPTMAAQLMIRLQRLSIITSSKTFGIRKSIPLDLDTPVTSIPFIFREWNSLLPKKPVWPSTNAEIDSPISFLYKEYSKLSVSANLKLYHAAILLSWLNAKSILELFHRLVLKVEYSQCTKDTYVRNIGCLCNVLRNNLPNNLPKLSTNYWFIAFSKIANFQFMCKYQINKYCQN